MKLFSCMLMLLGLTLGSVAYAQSQATPPQPQNDSAKTTVTGCLIKGAAAGQYTVVDSKSGEKTAITGPEQLDKYLNQTISLTGTMSTQGQDKVFKPESISQVSATCEKKQ